jgi:toxin ParE1/3/4
MNSLQNSALHYSVRYDDIRCMPLKKFPYMVHFRVNIQEKTVKVESLFNTWLNPEKWTDRNKS